MVVTGSGNQSQSDVINVFQTTFLQILCTYATIRLYKVGLCTDYCSNLCGRALSITGSPPHALSRRFTRSDEESNIFVVVILYSDQELFRHMFLDFPAKYGYFCRRKDWWYLYY